MTKGRVLEINVKTKKRKEYVKDFPIIIEPVDEVKGIDLEKLKSVLLKKGVIKSYEEIE